MSENTSPSTGGKNTLLIVILVAMAFFAGYLWNKVNTLEKNAKGTSAQNFQDNNKQNTQQNTPQNPEVVDYKVEKPSASEDNWRGSKNARYIWVEYSDLECPFCKKIHPDLIKVMSDYKDNLAWVYRHFPLPGHSKGPKSAEAVECARVQKGNDGFWQMTDLIFEKMPDVEISDFPDLATSIGLNKQTFSSCLDSAKTKSRVDAQAQEGGKAGVRATPTGIIFDVKTGKSKTFEGALPYESLKREIEAFMKG